VVASDVADANHAKHVEVEPHVPEAFGVKRVVVAMVRELSQTCAVPMEKPVAPPWSVAYSPRALLSVAISEIRFESRDCARSCAGFKVSTTTTARMAMMAITTRSSIRVNPRFFFMY